MELRGQLAKAQLQVAMLKQAVGDVVVAVDEEEEQPGSAPVVVGTLHQDYQNYKKSPGDDHVLKKTCTQVLDDARAGRGTQAFGKLGA